MSIKFLSMTCNYWKQILHLINLSTGNDSIYAVTKFLTTNTFFMTTSILKSKFATRNLFVLITVVLILSGCKKENTTTTKEKNAHNARF